MTLAKYLSVVPSSNSTPYSQVSRRRLLVPLLVSSSSLTVTPMYLSKLPMSSMTGRGYCIISPYYVSVGVVFSYPYYGSHVSHCGISLPQPSNPNPSKSSIMK